MSLLLVLLRITHLSYLVAALGLGLTFLGAGLFGLRQTSGLRSARVTFAVSLVYLMGLFAAIALDVLVA
jgi:protoheme IX farnesyltransferase